MRATRLVRVVMAAVALWAVTAWLPGAPAGAAPSAPVITGHPDAAVGTPDAAFSFHAPGADGYRCRTFPTGTSEASRPAYATCSGGSAGTHVVTGRADGSWTFEVLATDEDGDGPSTTHDWVVTSDPVVQWISEPSGTYTSRHVTATFSAAGATGFECSLDGGTWAACGFGADGTWISSALAGGAHTLQVRATDGSGPGPVASAGFTVDVDLPITWVSRPTGTQASRHVAATFTAPDATSYGCRAYRTDPPPDPLPDFSWCGSGTTGTWTSPWLETGAHRLEVRAGDVGMGFDPVEVGSTASTDFAIAPAMDVSWVARPTGTIASEGVAATFTAPGATGFECRLDLGSWVWCGGAASGTWVDTPAPGAHTLEVRALDGSEVGAAVSTTFTTAPPAGTSLAVAVTAGPAAGSTIASTRAAFAFEAPGGTCYRVELDGPDANLGDVPCYGQAAWMFGPLQDGSHVLRVQAMGSSGTFGAVRSHAFTVETDPVLGVDVTGPAAGSTIAATRAAFAYSAPAGTCFRVEVDGDDGDLGDLPCYGQEWWDVGPLADGPHTIRVQAMAESGQFGPVTEHAFTMETDPLLGVVVTGPAAGSSITSTRAAFAFRAPGGVCYRVEVDGPDGDLGDLPCYGQRWWDLGPLADGPHVIRLQAMADSGAFGPVTEHAFSVRSGTVAVVSSAPRMVLPSGAAAFAFSAPGGICFRVEVDGADGDLGSLPCYGQSWWELASLADGPHVLRVQAMAESGSFGPVVERAFVVETKDPETTILTGPATWSGTTSPTFTFASDEPSTFQCRLAPAATFTACPTPWTPTGLAQGPHSLEVRAVDGFGKVDATPATWTWDVDTVAPIIIQLTGPSGTVTDPTPTFDFLADEAPVDFECRLIPVDAAFAPCSSGTTRGPLADGGYRFEVRALDRAGNVGPERGTSFTLLTDEPDTVITSGPADPSPSSAASISFTSPDPGVTYECSLDGDAYAPCTSPRSLSGLADGPHTFLVRAVAGGVLADPTPASHQWVVDTTAPILTITSGPTGTVAVDGSVFTFTTSEPATVTCALDGAAPSTCASPLDLGALAGGEHTLVLEATDAAGNVSAPPTTRSWTVDDVAPVVTITGGPPSPTSATSGSVTFTVDDPTASAECSLDGGTWAPCSSPVSRTGLADGTHSVGVRATDPAGNLSAIAVHVWTVDTVPPVVVITSAPSGTVATTAGSVSFTVTDPSGATAECRVDLGAWVPCSSPHPFTVAGQGLHSISVRASDGAGNPSGADSRSWTVDTVAPVVTITSGPSDPTAEADAEITFTVDDPGPGVVVRCRLDGGAAQICASPVEYTGLGQGDHAVEVWATDAVGNVGVVDTWSWTIDTEDPETTITSAPPAHTNQADVSIAFTSDVGGATYECRLDSEAWAPCTSPFERDGLADGAHTFRVRATAGGVTDPTPAEATWDLDTVVPVVTLTHVPPAASREPDSHVDFTVDDPTAAVECRVDGGAWAACASPFAPALGDGAHTVDVRATDDAGNVGTAGPVSWTLDRSVPAVVITGGPANGAVITVRTATYTFTVDDPTATVSCRVVPAEWGPCTGAGTHTLSGLADGAHTFQVRAVDEAGNEGATARGVTVDATAPTVTITSGPPAATSSTGASVSFTVDDPTATVACRVDGGAWSSPCPSPVVLTGLAEGGHSVEVEATDPHGNVGVVATRAWTVDLTRPTVTITSGPSGPVPTDDVTFGFEADEPATFECRVDDGDWDECTSPHDVDDLPVGEHTFRVRATDEAGHVSDDATRTFTVEVAGVPVLEVEVETLTWRLAPLASIGLGDDFYVRASVTNTGEAAAEDARVTIPLSADLRTVRALPAGCSSPDADGPVSCDLGGVAAGATETIDIRVEAVFGCTRWGDSRNDRVADVGSDLLGTTGADVICGGGGADAILGRGGADTVYGYGPTGPVSTGAPSVAYGPGELDATAPTAASILVGGTDGGDVITTGAQSDVVWGQGGDDVITTGGGGDTADGGDGNDQLDTGAGNDTLRGGPGNDSMLGGDGGDTADGGDGDDQLDTAAGSDTLRGGPGNDTLAAGDGVDPLVDGEAGDDSVDAGTSSDPAVRGGEGNDTVLGGSGNDDVDGGAGSDPLVDGGIGVDTVRGGVGNDVVTGGAGNDVLVDGEAGHDLVDGGAGNDPVVRGGDGNDTVSGGSGNDDVRGGNGHDPWVDGGPGRDLVNGDGGNDQVTGGADADTAVHGGPGDDVVRGGDGDDTTVHGGDGRDQVFGDAGNDPFVYGGEGDDLWVDGGAGVDSVYGGVGDDAVSGGDSNDTVVNGQEGSDWVYGGEGNDPLVVGGDGSDHLIDGGGGNDVVFGQDGDDELQGGAGRDRLEGGPGDDVLGGGTDADALDAGPGDDTGDGGDGNDTITGGDGDDVLHGGAGNDSVEGAEGADDLYGGIGDDDLDGGAGTFADRLHGEDGQDILFGRAGDDHMLGGPGHDYMDGNDGDDYLNGQTGRDVLRGNAGDDELDGGPAAGTKGQVPGDHWNRLYGDAGEQDVCHHGPGTVETGQMTSYRDSSCELRDVGVPAPGAGWLFGSRDRLDRGRSDPATYPG